MNGKWLIPSNVVNYVQYNRNPKDFYDLNIKALDQRNLRKIYDKLKEEDGQVLELNFGDNPDKLRGKYLDMYEVVKSEVLGTTTFDENSDLSMIRASKIKVEEKFLISEKGHTVGKLLDDTEC